MGNFKFIKKWAGFLGSIVKRGERRRKRRKRCGNLLGMICYFNFNLTSSLLIR